MKSYIQLKNLTKQYHSKGKPHLAVNNLSLDIHSGETLGLIGESGSGKSTLGKMIVRLEEPTSGQIIFNNQDITKYTSRQMRPIRQKLQIVFQDPYSSLNPRMRIEEILSEPLEINGIVKIDRKSRVVELLKTVELHESFMHAYPHELSGGQRQRVAIARSLALDPSFIVLDEPLSALDATIQVQMIDLFQHLKSKLGLGYLLISHDLHAVYALSDRIAVMYKGELVEIGHKDEIVRNPQHPYTKQLLHWARA